MSAHTYEIAKVRRPEAETRIRMPDGVRFLWTEVSSQLGPGSVTPAGHLRHPGQGRSEFRVMGGDGSESDRGYLDGVALMVRTKGRARGRPT